LERFPAHQGVGASGLNFFDVPGIASAADRRDILILKSLADTLDLLAGQAFAAAFGLSASQDDYRWGKLHRIVFSHPLGGPFSVPSAFGLWPDPLPGLPGIPVDGGFSTIDVGDPVGGVRGADADAFMFDHGPAHRFISEARPDGVRAEMSSPLGTSGVPGDSNYLNLLPGWLSNTGFPLLLNDDEISAAAVSVSKFVPAGKTDPKSVTHKATRRVRAAAVAR
jgi:penicillin amidase